jgi:N-acetylglucosamine-6-phosphate deacetylase
MDLGIRAGRLITPTEDEGDVFVAIEAGTIRWTEPFHAEMKSRVERFIDACDCTVVPGFVDLQVNGGLGCNFSRADAARRREVYRFFLRRGTTTLAPTVVSDEPAALAAALSALAEDVGSGTGILPVNDRQQNHGQDARATADLPEIPGLHLEGPFLNPDRRGAHPLEHIRPPDLGLARELFEAARRRIVILTLAPELDGALPLIRWFAGERVVVSAGHTMAPCDLVLRACDEGLRMLTHVGNTSDWPYRRKNAEDILTSEPAVVGAFMISDRLRGSVIVDGYHLDPRLAAALMRLRGPHNVALISDASYATGLPPGEYDDGLIRTTVHPDGYAYATGGGGWLAGSVIALDQAVRVAVRQGGVALREAVEMATLTPARILGLEGRKGRIASGYDADLVFLDSQLAVKRVLRAGREVV